MTVTEPIELKRHPEVRRIVLAGFPNYRKQKAYVRAFHPIGINSYWDGGSRSEFALVEIATGRVHNLPTATHPYFDVARHNATGENDTIAIDRVGNITLKQIPDGFALVEAGTFCGKPSTARVLVNEANLTRFLPATMEA